ncbi:type II toxin-antitoxin system HicB family antitoxin [Dehalococcoidia bacterium]|nr:type II toxin-antitoxin system HicB family antitoxin [Dehalococcoidia bacterium]MCL0078764.1 type II toxin-antitoxin system HicB family antitoxin [Dehalococcoidia bacterium]MCL0090094.1 type II toxin-antitoxin system HicB family antitoxin [Dehalococcoidia bacterium]MCL0095262.1 type II toxin-antitoxin system HicB family antitoxin [Dehalococcoidia bacterium]MCL0097129.1 type II toxin-antitoxin system HicB family antitoxin [Dehalococcoidia bacterium]
MKIKVILEASEEGGFTAYVPSLPGCISEGDSEEEALVNIKEAIDLYLEPVEDELFVSESLLIKEVAV